MRSHRVNGGLAAATANPIVQRTERPGAARDTGSQPGLLKMTLPSGALAATATGQLARWQERGIANMENPRASGGFLSRAGGEMLPYSEITSATARLSGSTMTTSSPDTMNL